MLLLLPVARGDTGNGLRAASDSPDTHRSDLADTLSSWQAAFEHPLVCARIAASGSAGIVVKLGFARRMHP